MSHITISPRPLTKLWRHPRRRIGFRLDARCNDGDLSNRLHHPSRQRWRLTGDVRQVPLIDLHGLEVQTSRGCGVGGHVGSGKVSFHGPLQIVQAGRRPEDHEGGYTLQVHLWWELPRSHLFHRCRRRGSVFPHLLRFRHNSDVDRSIPLLRSHVPHLQRAISMISSTPLLTTASNYSNNERFG